MAPAIHNGFFTIKSPTGQHRTFRVRTWKHQEPKAPLKRSVDILVGSDNTASYVGLGFVRDDGRVSIFRRHVGTEMEKLVRCFENVMAPKSSFRERGMTVEESRRCLICNRLLTTPESLASGIGPICEGR